MYGFLGKILTALLVAPVVAQAPLPDEGLVIQPKLKDLDNRVDLDTELERIRRRSRLPALGGAIVTLDDADGGLPWLGTTGFRRRWPKLLRFPWTWNRVTDEDLWHIGSCTKAMTSTLMARLLEQGTLPSWDFTLQEAFPDIDMTGMDHASITVSQLLSHTSGLPRDFPNFDTYGPYDRDSDLVEARQRVLREDALDAALLTPPGTEFWYSNLGYVVAAAVAEALTGQSWEELMQVEVFGPLGMTTAGFGPMVGIPGVDDQPWQHDFRGYPTFFEDIDLPAVGAPAGLVHMSLADWAKFVRTHLAADPSYLAAETYTRLHTPVLEDSNYAFGWGVAPTEWSCDVPALLHGGTNALNLAFVWLVPGRDFAALCVSNQGGALVACDQLTSALIARMLEDE